MEAERERSDSAMKKLPDQNSFAAAAPITLGLTLNIALVQKTWQNQAQVQYSCKSYAETNDHGNAAVHGCRQDSSLPQWTDEAQSTVSTSPLPRDVPCQANRNDLSRWGLKYSRRNKLPNPKTAALRQCPCNPLAQCNGIKFTELLSTDQFGFAHSMGGILVEDGSSRSGLLVNLNSPCSESMCMDSTQHNEADCTMERQHFDNFQGNSFDLNSSPDLFSGGNRNTYAPMSDQSNLTPHISTSSTAQMKFQQYTGEKNQVAATGVHPQDLENKHEATPGSVAPGGKASSLVENHNLDKGSSERQERDCTLPKKPRKKKHRPKVITEGKPKRVPKLHTAKHTNPEEDTRVKRKYERRTKSNKPSKTSTGSSKVANPAMRNSAVNSSRRSLNFDLGEQPEEGSSLHKSSCNSCTRANGVSVSADPPDDAVCFRVEEVTVEEPNADAYDISHSANQLLKEYTQLSVEETPTTLYAEEIPQTTCVEIPQILCAKEIPKITEAIPSPEIGKVLTRYQKRKLAACMEGSHNNFFLDICKKRRTKKFWRPNKSSASASTTKCHWAWNHDSPGGNPSASKYYYKPQFPFFTTQTSPTAASRSRHKNGKSFVYTWPDIQKLRRKRSKHPTRGRDMVSLSWFVGGTKGKSSHPKKKPKHAHTEVAAATPHACMEIVVTNSSHTCIETFPLDTLEPQATKKRSRTKLTDYVTEAKMQDFVAFANHTAAASPATTTIPMPISRPIATASLTPTASFTPTASLMPTATTMGIFSSLISHLEQSSYQYTLPSLVTLYPNPWQQPPWQPVTLYSCSSDQSPWQEQSPWQDVSIDLISGKLQKLYLNEEVNNFTDLEENALLPRHSQGEIKASTGKRQNALVPYQNDGTLVPYQDPLDVKKRPYQAKVHLDDETTRVWNLLLEKIDNTGVDGTDQTKVKWWEEERTVFRGRVDSFIARMRLVQGDRRFSPWKGSVVDSVVGVFLTQNVSDHLSSSAFMSLASRYPSKPRSEARMDNDDNISASVEDPTSHEGSSETCDGSAETHYVHEHNTLQENKRDRSEKESRSSTNETNEESELTVESTTRSPLQERVSEICQKPTSSPEDAHSSYILNEDEMVMQFTDLSKTPTRSEESSTQKVADSPQGRTHCETGDNIFDTAHNIKETASRNANAGKVKPMKAKAVNSERTPVDWDSLRKQTEQNSKRKRSTHTMDSVDYEAVRRAGVEEIAHTIIDRGMNNRLAMRIEEFLNRLTTDHGDIDLEWLRDVPPDKAKEYLLSFKGLGLKSVECVRLLTLHNVAFPVDTNVGRIAVRLGWVPLQPLPESLQLHLLELYPIMDSIQQYLWPRLCKLDQKTLYELHYHMITFGKVFCTKKQPNCNACPLRGECRHFASAFASARLALPCPEEKTNIASTECGVAHQDPHVAINPSASIQPPSQYSTSTQCDLASQDPLAMINPQLQGNTHSVAEIRNCEPIIEVPQTPEPEQIEMSALDMEDMSNDDPNEMPVTDMEDMCNDDPNEIPKIKLNLEDFTKTLENYMQSSMELLPNDISKALVTLTAEAASIPTPKLKNVSRLRTEHHVYELPDTHPLLNEFDKREPDDPCTYLLAIWTPGETANSFQPPERRCNSQEPNQLCDDEACSHCNSQREASCQIVRGTILIPCRTAMRGNFPLNGTYFQVNEVFADHDSSLKPIEVPRNWIWNLPRRTVYFGSSIPTIFRGLTTEGIQHCFWKGYVCVRGFDQKTRAPRPLMARLHFPISKMTKAKGKPNKTKDYENKM